MHIGKDEKQSDYLAKENKRKLKTAYAKQMLLLLLLQMIMLILLTVITVVMAVEQLM